MKRRTVGSSCITYDRKKKKKNVVQLQTGRKRGYKRDRLRK
jgi:hypothetical protein